MAILCNGCYQMIQDYCGPSLTLPSGGHPEGSIIFWKITDKFGNIYTGDSEVLGDQIDIDVSLFPVGLFTPYSGIFKFEIRSVDSTPLLVQCDPIDLEICDITYPCIGFSFASVTPITPEPKPYV